MNWNQIMHSKYTHAHFWTHVLLSYRICKRHTQFSLTLFCLFFLDQWKDSSAGPAVKSLLPKPAPSGLRPPGYSRLPAARLAAFGFVRSSSVSSVSSNHSTDSTRSDPCRPVHRKSSKDCNVNCFLNIIFLKVYNFLLMVLDIK